MAAVTATGVTDVKKVNIHRTLKLGWKLLPSIFDITTIIANIFYIFNEHILYTKGLLYTHYIV